ncbi:TonB-dependent receptor [Hymenobacter psychrophilus]|uniref:Iron complex outermembrane recepter protein n=1 Tax=Hymenobacter psychrophilus TaxID=651662 RepID=A0A1H3ELJ4_9BACT|nr:TonB-dependent receptor [Hymenobacter psychrophilus]SDX79437.1 iron complex outermembrane recepter protein [Hymenobacter psychrophilus]
MKTVLTLLFSLLLALPALAQTSTLRGVVLDERSQPVPFANVALPALQKGTAADENGRFTLSVLPAGTQPMQISAVGYIMASQTVTLPLAQVLTVRLQSTESTLEEVVVTGVSRSTEIRRSPVPIAAITGREIRLNANGNAIDAAVRGVPGLAAVTTGPNISKPFIRGLGYNRVLTMFNGLRQEGQQWGDEHGIEVDGYGLDRVEVVKGPASLLYGSDAVAGVVNLLPALPTGPNGELHGEALAEYQSVNGLVGKSLAFDYQKNGFQTSLRGSHRWARDYSNPVDGRVYNTGFRELNLTGIVGVQQEWGNVRLWLTAYNNLQEIPDGSRDSLSRAFSRQVFDGEQDDFNNRPVVSNSELKSYRISNLHQNIQHYRAFATSELKTGPGELHLLLGVQQNHRQEFNHPTEPNQPGLDLRLTTLNYQARYLFQDFNGYELTVGVNGMGQDNQHLNATDFAIPPYRLFDIGGFGVVKKGFGALELTGGLRYDTRVVSWNDFYTGTDPATGFGTRAAAGTPGAERQFSNFHKVYRGVSASVGGSYAVGPNLVLRANVARGYRAPNIPEIGSNGLDPGAHIIYLGNPRFEPEFNWQEDVGVLWKSPGFEASVEAFYNHVENFIYQAKQFDANGQALSDQFGNSTYKFQQAAATLYGGELAFNVHPTALPWLSWRSGAALVIGLNKNATLRDREGVAARYLPLIPAPTAQTELRFTLPDQPGRRLADSYLRVSVAGTARQNRFYAVDGAETATSGYVLTGLGAGTTLRTATGRDVLHLVLQADNLFDVAYQSHLNRLKYFEYYRASPTGRLGIYSPGRNLSVKVVVPF